MQNKIYEAAMRLGYAGAHPVTGHPFDVWRNRLSNTPLGRFMSFEHDPVKITGWPLNEITIWVAIAPTPPMAEFPDGCGEVGGYYMRSALQEKNCAAWENAACDAGFEIMREFTLPERAAAIRAGFGVHGLNGLLITPEFGSFVNITTLLVHAAPPPEARGPEHDLSPGCGNCGDCVKACPTGAIDKTEGVNTLVCLRNYMNFTDGMTEDDYARMGRRIQGCDTCQSVCPKNGGLKREEPPADIAECLRLENLLAGPDMEIISKYIHKNYIKNGVLQRQAALAAANAGRTDLLPLVEKLIGTGDETLDKFARWAAGKLR